MSKIDWNRIIKPEVLRLDAYRLKKRRSRIKLDQNENPYELPAELKQQILESIAQRRWSRYPDFQMENITQRIAAHAGLPVENVVVGSGSNSLIQALLMVTLTPGDRVLVTEPTFTLYRLFSEMLGARVRSLRLQKRDFSLPFEELQRESGDARTKLLILCSPNNPTGNRFPTEQLEALVRNFSGLVVIDEAYSEFCEQDGRELLQKYENVVLLRTFSKALALAGLRVGYLLARPEFGEQVIKARLPYSVNLAAEAAVEVCLENIDLLRARIETIKAQRQLMFAELNKLQRIRVFPSDANFFLIRCREREALFEFLLENGILVRDVSRYPMLENCLRVSIGSESENRQLLHCLQEWDAS